ncbi:hypothetical protein MASR1M60_00500 [Rhodocyclaceae bacterium]
MNASHFKALAVLLVLLLPALLVGLDNRPVFKVQEVRVAETAREMLESGDWVVPRYNGDLRLQKPPLPYWLTAISYRLAGVGEVTTRLPSVLFGLLAATLIWLWAQREIGLRAAANSALILVTSYIGLRYFRSGEADAPLLFFISAACLLGYDITQGRRTMVQRLLFGLTLGLGFLAKGPAGLAIPLLAVAVMAFLQNRRGGVRSSVGNFFDVPNALLLLLTAFGWYLWILWFLPEVAQSFFAKQVDETFIRGSHGKPVWWYLSHWLEFFAPWGLLLVPAGWLAWQQRHQPTPPLLRFAWIWLAVVFVLLSATINKQMQYALLFAPPLAIILGHYLTAAVGNFLRFNKILFGLFCAAVLLGVAYALRKSDGFSYSMVLWLAIPVLPLLARQLLRETSVAIPVLLVAGLTVMVFQYSEAYFSKEPHKIAAQTLMAEAARYEQVYQLRTPLNDGALSFHAGKVIPPRDREELAALLNLHAEVFVVSEKPLVIPGVDVDLVAEADDLRLYRIRHAPTAPAAQTKND